MTAVLAIEHERVFLYQQFDDSYPALLAPHIARSAYRSAIHRINRRWRRASLLYLATLASFLAFALGPILLGAAAQQHNLTGVDEEVGVAMLVVGSVGVIASVVAVRVCSRRGLLQAVEAENERLKGSVPEIRFRLEHETVTVPVKEAKHATTATTQTTGQQQQQQQLESSESRLVLEVGQLPAGATPQPALLSTAVAEATLLSISSQIAQDPSAVLYHAHLCPHCLHDSPHAALPLHSLYPLSPLHSAAASYPGVSPLLATHYLSLLPHAHHMPPSYAPAQTMGDVALDITMPPPAYAAAVSLQPAAARPAAATGQ